MSTPGPGARAPLGPYRMRSIQHAPGPYLNRHHCCCRQCAIQAALARAHPGALGEPAASLLPAGMFLGATQSSCAPSSRLARRDPGHLAMADGAHREVLGEPATGILAAKGFPDCTKLEGAQGLTLRIF